MEAARLRGNVFAIENGGLFHDLEAEFFDDGIGEDFLGDPLDFASGLLAACPVQIEHEEFALADVAHLLA